MTVNGHAWPNMNVEANLYRVRLLNACNSRRLVIAFLALAPEGNSTVPFLLYKSDSSYYQQPMPLTEIELGNAARAEIVLDLTNYASRRILVINLADI